MTKGGLTPCPGLKIYGIGPVIEAKSIRGDPLLDIYEERTETWNGHPIYKGRNNKVVLVMNNEGNWEVAVDGAQIKGLPGRLCPSESIFRLLGHF